MARVYKIRKTKTPLQYTDTPVDNTVENITKNSNTTINNDAPKDTEQLPEILDNTVKNPEIILDEVPNFDENNIYTNPVENPVNIDDINPLISIPDRWYIKLPEDTNYPPLLNFYKDNKIVTSLPLVDENLNGLMPILKTFYNDPDAEPTQPAWTRAKKWMKKHKFSTGLGAFVTLIVLISLISAALTNLGLGIIQ